MANHKPVTVADDKKFFQALRAANVPEDLSYTAVQELGNMAGQNIAASITALEAKIDSTRWMMGSMLAIVAIAGAGVVAIGVAILNYVFQMATSN